MLFTCKACGAALKESHIDFDTGIARCAHCQGVMSFAEELKVAPPSSEAREHRQRKASAGRPEDLRIDESPVALRFSKRWYHPGLFFILFFAIAWNAFLVGWYVMGSQAPDMGFMRIIMFVFPLAHVAVGVGMIYAVLTGFLNSTTVKLTSNELSVRHGPIPAKGNRRIPASQIKQLYCKSANRRLHPRSKAARNHAVGALAPSLHARLHDNRDILLLKRINDLDSLFYIERRMEERLGIRDEIMPGEHTE